jgi:Epoxide hydrolase N terminus
MPEDATIRPFTVGFPDTELTDLRSRVSATRWPEVETVADDSQGAPLAMMQDLARYWATGYDWRTCEAKLNDLSSTRHQINRCDRVSGTHRYLRQVQVRPSGDHPGRHHPDRRGRSRRTHCCDGIGGWSADGEPIDVGEFWTD